jgi:beta-glucanase (GH16 family)
MRSTTSSRPHLSTVEFKFSVSQFCVLGVLVFSAWAGCQSNSEGLANPSSTKGAKTDGAGGQNEDGLADGGQGFGGATGGSPASDAGPLAGDGATGGSLPSQSTGTLLRDAGNSDLPDGASALGGATGSGGAAGTTATGGKTLIPDGGAGIDTPLGGTTSASSKPAGDVTGGARGGTNTEANISSKGGSSGTTSGGVSGGATGGSSSPLGDAGIDSNPDVPVPADAAKLDLADASSWRLVWSDEFDLEANAGVASSKWNVSTWGPGVVNNESQKYTARTQNIFHDGEGHLVLRALNDSYKVGATTYPYTSGRIQTDGKFEFKFGRVEVRAKLPAGLGSFPGMVLMGTNGMWPACGEIGLMEQRGQDKTSLTCSTYSDLQNDLSKKVIFPDATTLSAEFHTYALEWYTDHMVFFIDDKEVARKTFGASSPFASDNDNFYIILNVALGGTQGGVIDDSAFPMDMVLDYIRVYSL